jgi:hypothetical protein
MTTSPAMTLDSTAAAAPANRPNEAATRVYQVVTIAAMFLLLCSLWVF